MQTVTNLQGLENTGNNEAYKTDNDSWMTQDAKFSWDSSSRYGTAMKMEDSVGDYQSSMGAYEDQHRIKSEDDMNQYLNDYLHFRSSESDQGTPSYSSSSSPCSSSLSSPSSTRVSSEYHHPQSSPQSHDTSNFLSSEMEPMHITDVGSGMFVCMSAMYVRSIEHGYSHYLIKGEGEGEGWSYFGVDILEWSNSLPQLLNVTTSHIPRLVNLRKLFFFFLSWPKCTDSLLWHNDLMYNESILVLRNVYCHKLR